MSKENAAASPRVFFDEGKDAFTHVQDDTMVPGEKVSGSRARKSGGKLSVRKKHPAKANKYSAEEQLKKISQIEAQAADGTSTLKQAIKDAGLPEQTYYRWKRNGTSQASSVIGANAAATGDTFDELIALDQENERLRKKLADKLRGENSTLRRRLGLS